MSGKVLGIGGVFFKCKDREALGEWYEEALGFKIDPSYGGTSFPSSQLPQDAYTVWGAFKSSTDYFAPSDKDFMLNLMVDDVEACIKQVVANGGKQVGDICEEDGFGKFAWFIDPDGNKVELWQMPEQQ
ncbi:MAG: VOC family protein [Kangiella sp.]|nr:VOC family protein [Kangiella sp.]